MTFQRNLAWKLIDLTNRAGIAHQVARYALALDYSLLPAEVVHQAKRCVLDAIGCAIGAYEAPGRPIVEAITREIGGPEEATAFLDGFRSTALNISLVNAFMVRFLDYSDSGGGGHNSDCLSSILAVSEREKSSAKDFITSLVMSYEIGARFEEASHSKLEELGWTQDIRAGMNQSAALGKLMHLSEDQIANAIGVCMSHALPLGILDSHRNENVMAKNLRFGWAAHDAIIACMLAKKGFTGPLRIIESETGGINHVLYQGSMDLERLTDFSGWRIMKVKFKAMAANGTTHGHIYATLGIVKEHNLKPEDIAEVKIIAPVREAMHTTTPSKKYPRNAESGDHSAFYGQAHAIKYRSFGPESAQPERFTDPVILDLIEKMTVVVDPTLDRRGGASEVTTKDGRKFHNRIDAPPGLGGTWSDRELEDKFRGMASKHMSDAQIKQLLDTIWNLEELDDIGKLPRLTVFAKSK